MIKELSTQSDLDKAMEIYLEAFPPEERFPVEKLLSRFKNREELIYGYFSGEELIAIATIFPLGKIAGINEENTFSVLNYFAIHHSHRKGGVGKRFLDSIIKAEKEANSALIFEIENPYNGDESSVEYARLRFYRRCGCREYPDFVYNMPAFGGGMVNMRLLAAGAEINLSDIELSLIRESIYKQMYYLRDEDIERIGLLNV